LIITLKLSFDAMGGINLLLNLPFLQVPVILTKNHRGVIRPLIAQSCQFLFGFFAETGVFLLTRYCFNKTICIDLSKEKSRAALAQPAEADVSKEKRAVLAHRPSGVPAKS
jgi:hypothetical protein